MRLPLIFSELLELLSESDDRYESIKNCLDCTKEIAKEINKKKSNFQEIRKIEKQIKLRKHLMCDSNPRISNFTHRTLQSQKHNFKNCLLKKEFCIGCNTEISKYGMKCSNCGFFVHAKCNNVVRTNCKPIVDNSENSSLSSKKSRVFIERIDNLDCFRSSKKEQKIDLLLFNDGILIISRQDYTAIDFLKFYSSMTKQFCILSKTNLKGKSSFTSFTVTSAR